MYFYTGTTTPLFILAGIRDPQSTDWCDGWVLMCVRADSLKVTTTATMEEAEELPDCKQLKCEGSSTLPVSYYSGLKWEHLDVGGQKAKVVDVSRYREVVRHGSWFFLGSNANVQVATKMRLPPVNNGCLPQGEQCPLDTHARLMGSLSHLQTFFVEQ